MSEWANEWVSDRERERGGGKEITFEERLAVFIWKCVYINLNRGKKE